MIEKHPFRYLCLSDNLIFNVLHSSADLSWSLDWSHFDEWMQITLLRRLHSTYLKIRQKLSGLNGIVHDLQITVIILINWQFSFIFLISSRCNIIIHAPFIQVQLSYYLTTLRLYRMTKWIFEYLLGVHHWLSYKRIIKIKGL